MNCTELEELIETINYNFILSYSIMLTIVGIIGNSIVFYILTRPKFRNIPIFRYLIVSMVNDTINLITMWPFTLPISFNMNTISINCKLIQYFGYLFYQFCPWIIVVSSLDRLASIKFPTKFQFRKKLKFQAGVLTIIFIFLVFINIPFYFYYDIINISDETLCTTSDRYTQFYIDLANFLVSTIVPFFLMVLCTVIIAYHIIKNKNKLLQNNRSNFHKEMQFVKVMCAMNAFFLICSLPFCIQLLTNDILAINNIPNIYQSLIFNISDAIEYSQNAFGLFLYLSCNKVFRNHFKTMFFSKNSISPTSVTATRTVS